EVAIDIGLSIRQLRRQQKAAFHLLATYLWHHYDLEHRESSHLFVGEVEESNATPTRAEELAWSQQSFSSESIDVKAMVHTVIQTATPVLVALGVQEELVIPEDLPRLSAPRVTMQQALLSALTALVDAAPGG